jgi:hypothetical protein
MQDLAPPAPTSKTTYNPLVREVREGFRFGVGFIYGSLLFLLIGGALVFLYILVVALTTKSLSFD